MVASVSQTARYVMTSATARRRILREEQSHRAAFSSQSHGNFQGQGGHRVERNAMIDRNHALPKKVFQTSWERTNLVVRAVFKTAEAVARRLVGSIPTRSRQVKTLPPLTDFCLILHGVCGGLCFSLHRLPHRITLASALRRSLIDRRPLGQ